MVKIPIGVTESGREYAKFPDGTMIQWGFSDIPENEHMTHITYQHRYAENPSVTVTPVWTHDDVTFVTLGIVNADGFDVYVKGKDTDITKNRNVRWQAIGRWK